MVHAGGRDAAGLLPVLQCLVKFLVDPRYSRLLLGVAHRVLDTYSGEVRCHFHLRLVMQDNLPLSCHSVCSSTLAM